MVKYLPPSTPNVTFGCTPEKENYTISLFSFNGLLYASVKVNEEYVCAGVRVVNGQWLIPYKWMEREGNFRIENDDAEEYATWEKMSSSCHLVYYTKEEIEEMRKGDEDAEYAV